jgi:hypothetical protein
VQSTGGAGVAPVQLQGATHAPVIFFEYLSFAKSSFLFSPLPPAGGEGQGEGGDKQKLLSTSICFSGGVGAAGTGSCKGIKTG